MFSFAKNKKDGDASRAEYVSIHVVLGGRLEGQTGKTIGLGDCRPVLLEDHLYRLSSLVGDPEYADAVARIKGDRIRSRQTVHELDRDSNVGRNLIERKREIISLLLVYVVRELGVVLDVMKGTRDRGIGDDDVRLKDARRLSVDDCFGGYGRDVEAT